MPVTGKKTGKTKGVIGRSGEAAANEGKGLWNYLKGVGGRFKTMTSDLSEYHQGRKANKYIQKHGKLPEGYEEKQRKKIEGPQVVTEEPQGNSRRWRRKRTCNYPWWIWKTWWFWFFYYSKIIRCSSSFH